MAGSRLYKQREEVRKLLEISGVSEAEKKRWRKLIPVMKPSELLELRQNLLEQLVIDAEFETIEGIKKGDKEIPDDEKGLLEFLLGKVLAKVDKVEARTKRAVVV